MEMEKDQALPEMKHCQNCGRDVALANFTAHDLHCSRNTVSCPKCNARLMKDKLTEHMDENHVDVKCEKCQMMCNKNDLEVHQKSICSKRSKECAFCTLEVQLSDFDDHEVQCGSRTEPCPKCSRYIQLQDWKVHEISNCTIPEVAAAPPPTRHPNQPYPLFHDPYQIFPARGGESTLYDSDDELREMVRRINSMEGVADVSSHPPPPYSKFPPNHSGYGDDDDVTYPRGAAVGFTALHRYSEGSPPPNNRHRGEVFPSEHEDVTGSTMALHGSDTEHEGDDEEDEERDQFTRYYGRDIDDPRRYYPAQSYAVDDDDVKLPCEFCDELISANDLILHQSGCNEDINQVSNMPVRFGGTTSAVAADKAVDYADVDGDLYDHSPVLPVDPRSNSDHNEAPKIPGRRAEIDGGVKKADAGIKAGLPIRTILTSDDDEDERAKFELGCFVPPYEEMAKRTVPYDGTSKRGASSPYVHNVIHNDLTVRPEQGGMEGGMEEENEEYIPCELCDFPCPQSELFNHMRTCCGGNDF